MKTKMCIFDTLPETNSLHLIIGFSKRKVIFQPSIFRCELLVSGRVVTDDCSGYRTVRLSFFESISSLRTMKICSWAPDKASGLWDAQQPRGALAWKEFGPEKQGRNRNRCEPFSAEDALTPRCTLWYTHRCSGVFLKLETINCQYQDTGSIPMKLDEWMTKLKPITKRLILESYRIISGKPRKDLVPPSGKEKIFRGDGTVSNPSIAKGPHTQLWHPAQEV